MDKIKKYFYWGILLIVLLAGGYWILGLTQSSAQAASVKDIERVNLSGGEISATVSATGIVRTKQTIYLYWLTTGTVAQVNVATGDRVEAGQVLAVLEKESLPADVIQAEAELIRSQQELDTMLNSKLAQSHAYQALVDAKQETIDARKALDALDNDQYQDDLDAANEEVADAEDSLRQAQEDSDLYQTLDENNQKRVAAEDTLEDAQQTYDDAVQDRDLLVIERERAEGLLSEAQAQQEDAQREYDRLKNGPDPDDVAALQAQITAAQVTINLISLKAPFAGKISDMSVKPGDQIIPDKLAFRLDDVSILYVDLQVSEVDINQVAIGQTVTLTLDAIPMKAYHGKVVEIAKVGLTQQGIVDFLVSVELTDADQDIRPGMTAAGDILVNKLNANLLVPNRAVRVYKGSQVVYVVDSNNTLVPVEVTLGESSESYSEVIGGNIEVGDQIVLNPPDGSEMALNNGQPLLARKFFKAGGN